MYTTSEIAAQLCLEKPGVDTLDVLVFWKGTPTVASTRTILVNACLSKAYCLEQDRYVEWPADAGLYDVVVPGQHVIYGNSSYKQTGLMQAYGAYSLLQQPPKRAGFASGCQAFGHRELLGVLRSFGLVMEPTLTVQH
jgi:hypothetical protein